MADMDDSSIWYGEMQDNMIFIYYVIEVGGGVN